MADTKRNDERDNGPWYKQFWAWFVLAPILLVMVAWIPFMTIALKSSDDVVVDNYYREGRMYNMRLDQDRLARQLGLQGEVFVDLEVGEVVVTLTSADSDYSLPATLVLHLDHPLEADNDRHLLLNQSYPGRYLGELDERLHHRWYLRLEPVLATDAGGERASSAEVADAATGDSWRITGELDLERGSRLVFGGEAGDS